MLVAGRPSATRSSAPSLAAFAERAAIPLLAEPLSGARRGAAAVAHYDALLRDGPWADAHKPDLVLRVGDLPTSKPLRAVAARARRRRRRSPSTPSTRGRTRPATSRRSSAPTRARRSPPSASGCRRAATGSGCDGWRAADGAAGRGDRGDAGPARAERAARGAPSSARALPPNATLVVASSMPVRDVETFFPARDDGPRVLANRGANGIDGTVSTAFGVAAAAPHGPAVLLIGDVALAHDVGGLLAATRLGLKLTIVLIDNDGGGIFEFLPVSGEGEDYVRHVVTPHGLDLSPRRGPLRLRLRARRGPRGLPGRARARAAADRTTIVSVRTDREANVRLHRRCLDGGRRVRPGGRLASGARWQSPRPP